MKTPIKFPHNFDSIVFVALLLSLGYSVFWLARSVSEKREALSSHPWTEAGVMLPPPSLDFQRLETDRLAMKEPVQSGERGLGLFTSELRVIAIGSAYPIAYGAEVCPFSGTLQPAMNQLDRDGDGMTDDWEIKYGLDKYKFSDAKMDLDGDGFTNIEEFNSSTDPSSIASHPPYVKKLRFLGMKEVLFPIVFQGVSELSDGRKVFQINTTADGKTHFMSLGEVVEGIDIKGFIPKDDISSDRLVVVKNGIEVVLPRGEKVSDPESQAELMNILDHSSEIVTMGALLFLRNDEYTVLGVYPDKVTVRNQKTGEVCEVIGFAGGEQGELPKGFKE